MTAFDPLGTKDLLRIGDLAAHEAQHLLATAAELKADPSQGAGALAGKSVCMLFEKPSLRTRTSFEVGIFRLGGQAIVLDHQSSPIGERGSVADCARNLERWCHAIVARVRRHATVQGLAAAARVPVVNALCDMHHPCQALADFQTLLERGFDLRHDRLAWIGDGNNVCHSLMEMASILGCGMSVITPEGLEPDAGVRAQCIARSMRTGAPVQFHCRQRGRSGRSGSFARSHPPRALSAARVSASSRRTSTVMTGRALCCSLRTPKRGRARASRRGAICTSVRNTSDGMSGSTMSRSHSRAATMHANPWHTSQA